METSKKLVMLVKNQSELSRNTGITQSEISKMLRGERRLYLDVGLKIARALDVPLEYLADDGMDEPPAAQISPEEWKVLEMVRDIGVDAARKRLLQAPTVAIPSNAGPSSGKSPKNRASNG